MSTLSLLPPPKPPARGEDISPLIARALISVRTRNTYYSYRSTYQEFAAFLGTRRPHRVLVQAFIQHLLSRRKSPATVNAALSAIKHLAREAADSGNMDAADAAGILTIKGIPSQGRRAGNWLSQAQAQALMSSPDRSSLMGLRDRAVLALLLGGALRREEAASLEIRQLQQVATAAGPRWALVDVDRKHHRRQTIAFPAWAAAMVNAWLGAAKLTDGRILRAFSPHGKVLDRLSSQAIWQIVTTHSLRAKVKVSPHDLRRTVATLEFFASAPIEKIRQQLGHSSVQTTERYLRTVTDLETPACDLIEFT